MLEGEDDDEGKYYDGNEYVNSENELYCVASGACYVSYSSVYGGGHFDHYWIDYSASSTQAWSPSSMNKQQWIQVGSPLIGDWTKIILQGRGDADQWVETFKVSYTIDGKK